MLKWLKKCIAPFEDLDKVTLSISNHFNETDEVYFELISIKHPMGKIKVGKKFVEFTFNILPGEYEYQYIVNGVPTLCKTSPFRIGKNNKLVNYMYISSTSNLNHIDNLMKYLEVADAMGDCDARFRFGLAIKVWRDENEGVNLWMDLEDKGKCLYIYKYLGSYFMKTNNIEVAKYYYEKGVEGKCNICLMQLGKYYFSNNNLRLALQYFVQADFYGNIDAKEWIYRLDKAMRSDNLDSATIRVVAQVIAKDSSTVLPVIGLESVVVESNIVEQNTILPGIGLCVDGSSASSASSAPSASS